MNKIIESLLKSTAIFLFALLLGVPAAWASTASVSGRWDNPATWAEGAVPTSADPVTINSGITVNVPAGVAAVCNDLTVGGAATSIILDDATSSLVASGNVLVDRPDVTGNINRINVGAGTFSAGSLVLGSTSATTGSSRKTDLLISTGTATITGDITTYADAARITFSGAGTLNVGGSFTGAASTPTFTPATGTVNYNGAGAQTVLALGYSNLTLSGSGAKTMGAGIWVAGKLTIAPTGNAFASVANDQNLIVSGLTLGAVDQVNGTWGSTGSTATHQDDVYFDWSTSGILTVGPSEGLTMALMGDASTPAAYNSVLAGYGDELDGYSFTVGDADIIVSWLGWYDAANSEGGPKGDGLMFSIQIGLWKTSDRSLLADTTIIPGTGETLVGFFRGHDITPVTLKKNTTYIIAGHGTGTDLIHEIGGLSGFVARGITMDTGRYGYAWPDIPTDTWSFLIGPNFGYTLAPVAPATILTFGLPGNPASIDDDAKTIALRVPYGTPVTNLMPSYTLSSGTCDKDNGGPTGYDFSSPVTYTVTDTGVATNVYTVTVYALSVIETDQCADFAEGSDGYQTNVLGTSANLLADPATTLTLSGGAPANPPDGGGGTSTSWATLTDGSWGTRPPAGGGGPGEVAISSGWVLTYTFAASYPIPSIHVFAGWGDGGRRDPNVTINYSTDGITFLPLKVVNYGACGNSAWVRLGVEGLTAKAIQFAFGSQQNGYVGYTELAVQGPPPPARILSFGTNVIGSSAAIGLPDDFGDATIAWTVPYGTVLATLAPEFSLSSGTCNQTSGAVPSPAFGAGPVAYNVTDGQTNTYYAVTVTVAPLSTACDITAFNANFTGSSATISTTSPTEGTVVVIVPYGTTAAQVAALAPSYTLSSGATCPQPNPGIPTPALSTTTAVHYIVTAADGVTTKDYTVTVTVTAGLVVKTFDNIFGETLLNPIVNLMAEIPSGTTTQVVNLAYGDFAASLPGLTDNESFSVLWEGWFDVTKDGPGAYTFGTASDDGSMVYMDLNNDGDFTDAGELIVDNNGDHPTEERTGTVTLNMDSVHIIIGFYENGGGEAMAARFKKGSGLVYGDLDPINGKSGHFWPFQHPPPVLGYVTNPDGTFTLDWTSGMLLEATNVMGPWTTNTTAVSPFIVTPAPAVPQKYYRLQAP